MVAFQVGVSGGPFPLPGLLHQAGAGRILPDIQHGGPETFSSHGCGAVTCLLSVTYAPEADSSRR
jgi:hypothetical protein